MNLPQYRRAMAQAHERYRDQLDKAAEIYREAVAAAGIELGDTTATISHEFHDDPEECKAAEPEDIRVAAGRHERRQMAGTR